MTLDNPIGVLLAERILGAFVRRVQVHGHCLAGRVVHDLRRASVGGCSLHADSDGVARLAGEARRVEDLGAWVPFVPGCREVLSEMRRRYPSGTYADRRTRYL